MWFRNELSSLAEVSLYFHHHCHHRHCSCHCFCHPCCCCVISAVVINNRLCVLQEMRALMSAMLERLQRWFKKLCVMMNLFSSRGESFFFILLKTVACLWYQYIGSVHMVLWVTRLWCIAMCVTLQLEHWGEYFVEMLVTSDGTTEDQRLNLYCQDNISNLVQ